MNESSTPERQAGAQAAEPRAVALRYDRQASAAPEVVAKGRGELAQRIIEVARANGVPVQSDADLIELLIATDLGEEIPTEVYSAVAALLSYLYRLNGEWA